MSGRRGVLSAGTWCVDFNKSIARWPDEDTANEVLTIDRDGGGSGFNMALDLKRLDPELPVEAMGVVGDDDHLAPRHAADARDEAGARRFPAVQAVGRQRRELEERRARVEQRVHAVAHEHLLLLGVALAPGAARPRPRELAAQRPHQLFHGAAALSELGGLGIDPGGNLLHEEATPARASLPPR